MLEVATASELPMNGESWQALRNGNPMSEAALTSTLQPTVAQATRGAACTIRPEADLVAMINALTRPIPSERPTATECLANSIHLKSDIERLLRATQQHVTLLERQVQEQAAAAAATATSAQGPSKSRRVGRRNTVR